MNTPSIGHGHTPFNDVAVVRRDTLRLPELPSFDWDPLPAQGSVARRSVLRWTLCYIVVIGAVLAFHWSRDLGAAAPVEDRTAASEPGADGALREWTLPDVFFKQDVPTAEAIATF